MKISMIFRFLLAVLLMGKVQAEGGKDPLLIFSWTGGLSRVYEEEVEIFPDGKTVVSLKGLKLSPYRYQTTLSVHELAALNLLIDSCDFFKLTQKPDDYATDAGEIKTSVKRGEESRTFENQNTKSLEPLIFFVRRLINQAAAIYEIESEGDIYTAVSKLNMRAGPADLLQPDRLKQPLLDYVRRGSEQHDIKYALEGLCWITTPEEFVGLVSTEAGIKGRGDLIISAIPHGNAPNGHVKALGSFYLAFLLEYSGKPDLSANQKFAIESYPSRLGDLRYVPAIPFLLKAFERSEDDGVTGEIIPLAEMGIDGMLALFPYLDSGKENQRGNAIDLLALISKGNSKNAVSNPYSDTEYESIRFVFREKIVPKLHTIAETDPSASLKKRASLAIVTIQNEISK